MKNSAFTFTVIDHVTEDYRDYQLTGAVTVPLPFLPAKAIEQFIEYGEILPTNFPIISDAYQKTEISISFEINITDFMFFFLEHPFWNSVLQHPTIIAFLNYLNSLKTYE